MSYNQLDRGSCTTQQVVKYSSGTESNLFVVDVEVLY